MMTWQEIAETAMKAKAQKSPPDESDAKDREIFHPDAEDKPQAQETASGTKMGHDTRRTVSSFGIDDQIREIADHYGVWHQAVKTMEEAGELVQALAVFANSDGSLRGAVLDGLVGEMADVLVMVDQMVYLTKTRKRVMRVYQEKVDRQMARMRRSDTATPRYLTANETAEIAGDAERGESNPVEKDRQGKEGLCPITRLRKSRLSGSSR